MELPRKVQLTGRNTFIVSLPHEWVSVRGVSKGDAVYFRDNQDGTLTLSPKALGRQQKTCAIDVSAGTKVASMRNIVSAYVGGADRISVRGKGMAAAAEEARHILSGVEITEEREDEVVLRVLPFDDLRIDGVLGRMFSLTNSMFTLAISAFRDGTDVLTEIDRKEDDSDRLYLLLLRDLCIGSYPGKESVFKAIAAKSMEKVSDHLEDICRSGKGAMPDAHVAGLLEKASAAYSAAYRSFSKNGLDTAEYEEAARAYLADLEKAEAAAKKEKSQARMLILRSLTEKCTKTLRYSNDIMESGTDLAFAQMEAEQEANR
jgi:phosphate uptake regulator